MSEAYIDSIDGPGNEDEIAGVPNVTSIEDAEEAKRKFTQLWMGKISKSEGERRDFRDNGKDAVERYSGGEGTDENVAYPLFYSNVQVLHGAMYSSTPKPDVRRRYDTGDQVQQMVAIAIERGISHVVDTTDVNQHCSMGLNDYLVPGLGQARVSYDADVEEEPVPDPETGMGAVDEMGQPVMLPVVKNQKIWIEHVPWDCFIWEQCISWEDCGWVAFKHWLTREDIREQYDVDMKQAQIAETKQEGGRKLYCVYEIWDKTKKRIIFLAKGYEKPLKIAKDVLGLEGFFPCPRPMMANLAPGATAPIPDYFFYRTQERQIDRLTKRINNLTATSTVLRGFYDASMAEDLSQLSDCDDGEFLPVNGLTQKMNATQGGGDMWGKLIANWPIEQTGKVIGMLQQQRESELQHVYQITGISDIMRGYSKASETLGAQEIKQSAVSNRLAIRRNIFDQWVRDLFRITGDLMAKHYTPETWYYLTGMEITPEVEGIMKGGILLEYSVDIETDSTIHQDSDANKKMSVQAVEATANALHKLLPLQQQGLPSDAITQMVLTAMRPYKMTRNFEAAIMQMPNTQQQMQQMQQQVQQIMQQNQELTAQLQQAMQVIGAFDERKNNREDLKVEAEAERDYAQAEKLRSEGTEEGTQSMLNVAKVQEIEHDIRYGPSRGE